MKTLLLALAAVLGVAGAATPQTAPWTPIDIGVGLYRDSDPPTILARDKAQWGQRDLHDYFGLWMRGPNPATFANKYGTPIYMYKYRLSKDGGAPVPFGPYGFSSTGWGVSTLGSDVGSYTVEMLIVNRDTGAETPVATKAFSIVAGSIGDSSSSNDAAGTWDVYVGGLVGTADESTTHYHAVLAINKSGSSYSGTLRFDDLATTEVLASVTYGGGQLTFTRLPLLGRKVDQHYTAAINDNKFAGVVTDGTYTQKWWGTSKAGR